MKTSSLLVAFGLVLFSTLLMKASPPRWRRSLRPHERGLDLRADHCGGEPCDAVAPRLPRVLRPDAGRTGRQWPRVRRLPHADGQLPALAGQRRGEVPVPAMAAPLESGRGRSAVPARSTPTTSGSTVKRQRLQQSPPERSGPDHLPAAAEHQARSIRRPTRRRPRRRRRVAHGADGEQRRAHRTGRRHPCGRAARTRPAATSSTRASRRCRSRRSAR